ncbi:MAG: hypothetical protein KIT72_14430 [Polyangiaceae bacterium]|nr:hypothetical protein [Polyangiaceae bacterium]MCW5791610.1 hypothetical protein [Polyangiaceae bacterium]
MSHVVIRTVRPYATEEEFLQAEGWTLSRRGVVLLDQRPQAVGARVRFEVRLSGGQSVMRAEGTVENFRAATDDAPSQLRIGFTRFDASTKALIASAEALAALTADEYEDVDALLELEEPPTSPRRPEQSAPGVARLLDSTPDSDPASSRAPDSDGGAASVRAPDSDAGADTASDEPEDESLVALDDLISDALLEASAPQAAAAPLDAAGEPLSLDAESLSEPEQHSLGAESLEGLIEVDAESLGAESLHVDGVIEVEANLGAESLDEPAPVSIAISTHTATELTPPTNRDELLAKLRRRAAEKALLSSPGAED